MNGMSLFLISPSLNTPNFKPCERYMAAIRTCPSWRFPLRWMSRLSIGKMQGRPGLFSKARLSTQLIEAVQVISQGGKYFSDEGPEGKIF